MTALYNEIEPYAAQWMRNLAAAGHIANGIVDERSIVDLRPADVAAHDQVHFFAGIGGWSAALRMAGWPDDVPVWTGSCPCQPFSTAGRRGGFDDERHLWPVWFKLIRECCPSVVFGEQVASPDGLSWLDAVRADMEGAGYAFAAFDLGAAGVGAPHIRQRLYFVGLGITDGERLERIRVYLRERGSFAPLLEACRDGATFDTGPRAVADDVRDGLEDDVATGSASRATRRPDVYAGTLADDASDGRREGSGDEAGRRSGSRDDSDAGRGPVNGFWRDCEWVYCRDGKYRPIEPGTFPLAHGVPARVGRLRGYGNAIVRPLAATFIRAVMEHLCQK